MNERGSLESDIKGINAAMLRIQPITLDKFCLSMRIDCSMLYIAQ